ncbi:TonB-dependent receptor [Massilia aerilata]|uniref:TonB-dependent transporter Oar-like beta-barrel domain-containing protein n=1 Tax=Massilia aerilata TaxID=453817 RepID=A0ABW0S639_9BURK
MLKKTVLVHALTLAFSGAALTVATMTPAMAQSNATGAIYGHAGSDVKVVVENPATGLRRVLTPDSQGRFQATALPPGTYKVSQMRGDTVVSSVEVDATIGANSEAIFAPAAGIQTVQVTGQRRTIDVTSTSGGATFNARQLAALPVARNINAIIQLAPNTTRVDTRFTGGSSMGGGAASENSYYINGFPVVNPLTGLGSAQLPYGAIAEAQVLTGGFGAEFGRSIGGVLNIITKSGTNSWEAGAIATYQPNSMRASEKNIYYADTKQAYNAATNGTIRFRQDNNERTQSTYGAYVGGPIIKDKLFMFVSGEYNEDKRGYDNLERVSASVGTNGWRDDKKKIKRWLGKLDWNITDDHRLEYTNIGDTPERLYADRGFDFASGNAVGPVASQQTLRNIDDNGAVTNMAKYTGNITQDFTITALYGRSVSKHENSFVGYDPTVFSTVSDPSVRAPGLTYTNPQILSGNILAPGSKDVVKNLRLDGEYRLGAHTLRAGVDQSKIASIAAGVFKAGGGTWTYYRTDTPGTPIGVSGGTVPAPASGGGLGTQGYYVGKGLFSTVTDSYGEQSALYLEDKWQVTKDVLLTLGIRDESFKNQNDSHTTFLEMKNQINPRLAAAWDVNGDASLKVYGTLGRYSVPIPTHISVRGAGRSTFTEQFYTYTGVDAKGAPTGLVQLSPPLSGNNEFGQDKVVATLAALDMKPSYQDEITFGFERAWSPQLNFGAKFTYRKLQSTIDDFCDVRPFEKYAAANNIAITNPLWGNTCQTFNPGEDNVFLVDYTGDASKLTRVALTAAQQGFDKPSRTYAAVDLFAEHPFRNGWYGKVNYTWSRNRGNTEGQVRSDNGQADVAVTSTWDYPELMVGGYGLLPNDREHQIKAYGFYEVTKEWMTGANFLAASGRPRTCIGTSAQPGDSPNYANQSFWCLGSDVAHNTIHQRGSLGRLPWDINLDLNVAYKPSFLPGLMARVDVFNVTNKQTVQNVEERYNNGTRIRSTYETPLSYTSPRSVRLSVSYDKKF